MGFTERQKSELKNIAKEMSKEIVKELMYEKEFIDVLVEKLAERVTEKINEKIEKLNSKTIDLEKNLQHIQEEQESMRNKLEELEQSTKQGMLRIYGVTECNDNMLQQKVKEILNNNLGLDNILITHCRRIGSFKEKKNRPVLVVFDSMYQRNEVYFNKKKLKGTKITIVEELVKSRHDLLLYAKDKLGNGMVWTVGGKVYTRVNGRKFFIKTEDDVTKLQN